MKIKRSEADAILQSYVEQDRLDHLPPQEDEVTQKSYAEMCGFSPDKAARKLEDYVRQGLWVKRRCIINGKPGLAYKPVKAKKK